MRRWLIVLAACRNELSEPPAPPPVEEPLVAPALPKGARRPGCSLDTPLAAWCFPNISYAYRDFAAAVGSPKLLRQRIAAAGVRRCEISGGATLEFDERGNLIKSDDPTPEAPQRAEATWVEDRLATTRSTWMGGKTETLSSVTDDDCRHERSWGGKVPELHDCWSDGAVVAGSDSRSGARPMLARATANSIGYPKGYRQEWDVLGRITRTVTGDGIEILRAFDTDATRMGDEIWSLDARGLPTSRQSTRITCQ